MTDVSLYSKAVSLAKDINESCETTEEITRLLALLQQLLLIRQTLSCNPSP